MKQTTLYVTGMHCAACELLIEKKLLTLEKIEGVDASLKDGKVVLHTEHKFDYSLEELNALVADLGYTLQRQQPTKEEVAKQPILYYEEGKGIQMNKKEFFRRYEWLVVIASLFIGWKLIGALEIGRFMSPEGPETLLGVVALGIIASLSSCAALIGGLLMSLTKQWHEQTLLESTAKKAAPHMQFHFGRVLGFAFFGAILGALGDVITLDNITVYAVLVLVVSAIMGVLALQMLGISWANRIRLRMPSAIANNVLEHPKRGPFLIGAGTFFLPCGFTLIAQALALASGSLITGAIIMALFAIGTLPVLLGISVFGLKMNSKPHRTALFNRYAGVLVLLFALYNINGQLNVLGLPSMSDIQLSSPSSDTVAAVYRNEAGEQEISIIAKGFEYTATSEMTIEAGVPTKLIVDDQGMQGCGVFLAVAGLTQGYVTLQPGTNVIDLGSPPPGTYKITCSMGMVRPVILQVV